jgi:hypothetical protein
MCEGGLWPPFISLSVFGKLSGKIRLLELVSSNSENISCVDFLKHKTTKNRELALWHLVNRLVITKEIIFEVTCTITILII